MRSYTIEERHEILLRDNNAIVHASDVVVDRDYRITHELAADGFQEIFEAMFPRELNSRELS